VLKISWLDAIRPILFLLSLITQSLSTVVFWKHLTSKKYGKLENENIGSFNLEG
jgi:hypothetical protein